MIYGPIRRVGEKVLGVEVQKHRPAWQVDNAEELGALAEEKRKAFANRNNDAVASAHYKAVCKRNKRRVKAILNKWWDSVAQSVREAVDRKEPQHQYRAFRELRRVFEHGRKSTVQIKDKDGNLLHTKEGRLKRWQEHFQELLSVPTTVSESHMERITVKPINDSLSELLSFAETLTAIESLKDGKAAGPDGIPAELIKSLSY